MQTWNNPRFNLSCLRHSAIWGAGDEAVLNNVLVRSGFSHPLQNPGNPQKQKMVSCFKELHLFSRALEVSLRNEIIYGGLRSGVPDPYQNDTDPDPRICTSDYWIPILLFVSDLQDTNKNFFLKVFCLLLYIILKDKKSDRRHKRVEIKVFLTILLDDGRIRICTSD
jgi:hypothetical protein